MSAMDNLEFYTLLHTKPKKKNLVNRRVDRSLISLILFTYLLMMVFLFVDYLCHISGGQSSNIEANIELEDHTFCTMEVQKTIPFLREAYDDRMNKVLYVGPDTGTVMFGLFLDEEDYEAWGVQPYDTHATDTCCWDLIEKGIVRVANMKFPLPYSENSFSHVIISDTFEYMPSGHINKTISELMRVSRESVIIFAGHPHFPVTEFTRYRYNHQAKLRSPSWWRMYLSRRKFKEDEAGKKKLKKILRDISYKPVCQILLLKSSS